MTQAEPDIAILRKGYIATVEMRRSPHNFFDAEFVHQIADAFESLDADSDCRAIVFAAQGKSFCAGANLLQRATNEPPREAGQVPQLYAAGLRLFATTKPVVAAVHGPAIGGGLGLALAADFRVTCAEARFAANFARIGMHAGFGLTCTLPRLIGQQKASLLLYTGRRVDGAEAVAIGLADELVAQAEVRPRAEELAREIALSAPIAVESMRATLRKGLAQSVRKALGREAGEQHKHMQTADFREGVQAMAARRDPVFNRN